MSIVLALMVYFIIWNSILETKEEKGELISKWLNIIIVLLYIEFMSLLAASIWLIISLSRKRDQVGQDPDTRRLFNKEITTLVIIMVVFSISYLVRALWDQIYTPKSAYSFTTLTLSLLLGLCFDFFPVSLLLTLHFINFRTRKITNGLV